MMSTMKRKTESKCDNNKEKLISIDHTMQITDPKNTPLKREPGENDIKVLLAPEDGDQILFVFTLPKNVDCTVQDIITRMAGVLRNKIVNIFLVKDPVFKVRYVFQISPNPNINDHNMDSNSRDKLKNGTHAAKGLSRSFDSHTETESENGSVTSTWEPKTLKRSLQVLTIYPNPPSNGSITIAMDDLKCLDSNQYLNDTIIDFYLKYLVNESLSSVNRQRIHLFSSFFYSRLTDFQRPLLNDSRVLEADGKSSHDNVKRWTKDVNLFEKDFVIIPIQENEHWFLTIICYPNMIGDEQNQPSPKSTDQNQRPRILIFESIPSLKFRRFIVAKVLKNYIQDEYKAKFGRDCTLLEYDLDAVFLDIPKQLDNTDCGLYLLQYAENFLKDYVTDQELKLPLKSLENWFDIDVIKKKRDQLKKLIIKLSDNNWQIFKKRRVSV